jgi:hypothetical protein
MAAPCPDCGFDAAPLSPPDALVALRSFPRRFAEVGQPDDDDVDADSSGGPTATTLAAAEAAADAIAASGEQLRRVLVEDTPVLGPAPDVDAEPASAPADAIDRLRGAAEGVADLAAAQPASAWSRTGRRNGQNVTAADLLREAVHAGAHELRVAADAAEQG